MPISKFATGCGCDCCVVFDSRFCEYINKNFPDDTTGGVAFPVEVGDFVESEGYQLNRTFCSGNQSCAAQSSGYYHYETFAFAYPNTSPATPNYNRLVFNNPLTEYSWFTWMQFDHEQNPVSTPYRNRIYFMFDYTDEDNWIGAGVEYDPNYGATPGAPDRIFKVNMYQSVNGTVSYLIGLNAEKEINLGSGSAAVDVLIQVNVEPCDSSENTVSIQIGETAFQGTVVSYNYTPASGGKSGIAPEFSAEWTQNTIVCDGRNNTYITHQQIYKIQLQRTANDLSGCQTWANECGCECAPSLEYDVTFSGLADPSPTCSGVTCDDLNTTFTLTRATAADLSVSVCGIGDTPCVWIYEDSNYSAVACNVNRLELVKCSGSTGWKLLVLLDLGGFYEVMAKFESTETDCILSNLDMGSIVSGCWYDSSAGFCPSPICDASSLTATVSSS